ncbi:conserved hypothetical protein [Bacillus sp. 349Y]|nr:conserved hypothetical protein [Bacillus sp. 349Y]
MFDPTAFDNLKVVLEGAVYDFDLGGEIDIVDRKDLFDFAHYERKYQIQYRLKGTQGASVRLELKADAGHFLAERNGLARGNRAGAVIAFTYLGDESLLSSRNALEEFWGQGTSWEWLTISSSHGETRVEGILAFFRVITEEMVDDVIEMVAHSIESLLK